MVHELGLMADLIDEVQGRDEIGQLVRRDDRRLSSFGALPVRQACELLGHFGIGQQRTHSPQPTGYPRQVSRALSSGFHDTRVTRCSGNPCSSAWGRSWLFWCASPSSRSSPTGWASSRPLRAVPVSYTHLRAHETP